MVSAEIINIRTEYSTFNRSGGRTVVQAWTWNLPTGVRLYMV